MISAANKAQILSSRKTRIKTASYGAACKRVATLRYYPPEKQGLRLALHWQIFSICHTQILSSRKTRIKTLQRSFMAALNILRYYPPEKQGLRQDAKIVISCLPCTQILSSRKTRIKTGTPKTLAVS